MSLNSHFRATDQTD